MRIYCQGLRASDLCSIPGLPDAKIKQKWARNMATEHPGCAQRFWYPGHLADRDSFFHFARIYCDGPLAENRDQVGPAGERATTT